jgi:hypothetical protein
MADSPRISRGHRRRRRDPENEKAAAAAAASYSRSQRRFNADLPQRRPERRRRRRQREIAAAAGRRDGLRAARERRGTCRRRPRSGPSHAQTAAEPPTPIAAETEPLATAFVGAGTVARATGDAGAEMLAEWLGETRLPELWRPSRVCPQRRSWLQERAPCNEREETRC